MGGVPAKTPKDVYVYPLHADWRRILQHGPPKAAKPRRSPPRGRAALRAALAGADRHLGARGRAVGPLPPARGGPAAAAAGLGRGDLPGPRQGGRGGLPQRSPRRPRPRRCHRLVLSPQRGAGKARHTAIGASKTGAHAHRTHWICDFENCWQLTALLDCSAHRSLPSTAVIRSSYRPSSPVALHRFNGR